MTPILMMENGKAQSQMLLGSMKDLMVLPYRLRTRILKLPQESQIPLLWEKTGIPLRTSSLMVLQHQALR